jgi:hypothetical protein
MRPKPIPELTKEQFAVVQKEMKRTPSKRDIERIERAKETVKRYSI